MVSCFVDLWFKESGLTLSHEEIDKEINSIVSTYPSDSAFREMLSSEDIAYAQWATKIEQGLKKKKVLAEVNKNISKITEPELLSFYNENKTKYSQPEMVLLTHIQTSDEGQAEIVKKLLRRESFSEVAKKYSSAYSSEAKDFFGWIEKGYFPDIEKAFKLRAGETFGPVTMAEGVHIFKIIEKRPFKIKSFSDVRTVVLSEVRALRETAKFTAWLDVQIKRYKIKKNLNMLNSIRVETQ